MRRLTSLALPMVAAAVAWSVWGAPPPAPAARPVTAEEKRQALAEMARLMRTRYAVAETGEQAAATLERNAAAGSYDGVGDAAAFGEAVTRDLRSVTHDKHLKFGFSPREPAPAPARATDAEAEQALQAAEMRQGNFGLPRAEVLAGNVGLLEVRRFQPPEAAGDTIAAAVAFLAHCDAAIIDLRNCRGGSAWVMPIFTAYFLPRPTSLYTMVFRASGSTERFWSAPWVPGEKLANVPLYILTSRYTFSGAEGLAYRFQVLKRAVIVGETTGGGANAGGVVDAGPLFRVWLPMGRPVDADTGTNWEGAGVVPDVPSAARDALAVAHEAALERLRAEAASDHDRARLDAALERARAALHPFAPSAPDLERLAGRFGACRVWVEGGQLRVQRENEPPFLLTQLSASVFVSDTAWPVRVEFVRGVLVFTDEDGVRAEYVRS